MKNILFCSMLVSFGLATANPAIDPIDTLPQEVISIADDIATMIINRKAEQSPEEKKETAIKLITHVTNLATEVTKIIIEKRKIKRSLPIDQTEIKDEVSFYLTTINAYISNKVNQATS